MNRRPIRMLVLALALIVGIVGAGMTLASLAALRADAVRERETVASYRRSGRRAVPIAALLRTAFKEQPFDMQDLDPPPVQPEWKVRRVRLKAADVPLDQLGQFLHAVEMQKPPWRLTECALHASAQHDRAAQVELVLQTVERVE